MSPAFIVSSISLRAEVVVSGSASFLGSSGSVFLISSTSETTSGIFGTSTTLVSSYSFAGTTTGYSYYSTAFSAEGLVSSFETIG
jgi:hypothetical protein